MKWVRPGLSIAFAGTCIYGFVIGKVDSKFLEGITLGIIGWWFWAREKEKAKRP